MPGAGKKGNEAMHWADSIAKEVIERVKGNPVLKSLVKEKGFIVYDEKTPSGQVHIGSGRGWIIHDAIARALRDAGVKGRFVLSSDDIDPFDKWNEDLDSSFKKHLGKPFRDIPSPVHGYRSFADYYFQLVTKKFPEFGIEAELESTGSRYDDGSFNNTIKKALNDHEKIRSIYNRLYGDNHAFTKRLPFNPICEKCGKIGTTEAIAWDPETEMITYRCRKDLVKWAEGCGNEGKQSPYNGRGKFPWKVEWAAKWPSIGVVAETAGKDHFTKGGARDIAIAICHEVFGFPVPWPSTPKKAGMHYEFFTVGGKKMSTSRGTGITFSESTDYAPANILRYLLVRTRPHAVIDFNPSHRNDMILLYERFDKTERIYYGYEDGSNLQETQKQKRIYELSHVGPVPERMIPQIPFIHASMVIQTAHSHMSRAIELLKKTCHLSKEPSKEEADYAKERLSFAKKWIENFAPDEFKFAVLDEPGYRPHLEQERKAFKMLAAALEKDLDEEALFNEFYEICKQTDLDNKDFFKIAYQLLIGKEQGPRLAPFILAIGKEKVLGLLHSSLEN